MPKMVVYKHWIAMLTNGAQADSLYTLSTGLKFVSFGTVGFSPFFPQAIGFYNKALRSGFSAFYGGMLAGITHFPMSLLKLKFLYIFRTLKTVVLPVGITTQTWKGELS